MLSPDIGVSEMLIVAAVALIVVGPKDLPLLMRRVGQFLARLRGMASEFRASFEDMARQSELEELRKEVEAMRSGQYSAPVSDAVDAARDPSVDQVFADIDAGLRGGGVNFAPPMASRTELPVEMTSEPVMEALPKAAAKPARKPRANRKPPADAPEALAMAPVAAPAPRRRKARTGDAL
jgi:sec-independent protein translocase protein TatB